MPRPPSLLPALVAAAAVLAVVPAAPAAAAPIDPEDPLLVTIEELTPGELPERGPVTMRGTVTNVSDERWRAINVHAFIDDVPLTTTDELAAAAEVPTDVEVGDRITTVGTFDSIGSLDPGETTSYSIRLRRDQIPVDQPGAYWFGAHALGNTTAFRDGVADGRARTFLPLVEQSARPVRTALVVPMRRAVRHARDGSITGTRSWVDALSTGGSLETLADLGAAAGSRPLTWLVDPAVPQAVQRLVAGNPPRSLADTVEDESDPEPSEEPSESPTGSTASGDEEAPVDDPAAVQGTAWLERMDEVLVGDRVLTLAYGDPDVSAATDHGPDLLTAARERSGEEVAAFDLPAEPVVAPPEGLLSPDALARVPSGTVTLLGDDSLPEDRTGNVFDVDGRMVHVADSDVSLGGPGPEDPLTAVALRQRLLAEAAVRTLSGGRPTLVAVLPRAWAPDDPAQFFTGLDVDWVDLTDLTSLTDATELAPDALAYPPEERERELPAANFLAAEALMEGGATLANVLTQNDVVDRQVSDEALASLSSFNREVAERVRTQTLRSQEWVERRLSAVRVRAPLGVTLSSATGGFVTTVTNRLDHPVTVSLKAITDAALSVEVPQTIDLAPRGRQTVQLDASADRPGVHYVRLVVTDDTGTPLGSSATLPVRSTQVSEVIWVILGVGVGLLFLAIAVRLVQRIRSERA